MEENKKYSRYGTILYFILKIIFKTLRVEVVKSEKIDPKDNYTYGGWHNKLVIVSLCLKDVDKMSALASPSKDGELIAVPLERMGYEVVRGSSGKGSVRSLIRIIGLVKKGYSVVTPCDGPKGPIYNYPRPLTEDEVTIEIARILDPCKC